MLTAEERAVYDWQLGVPGFGEQGQEKLKSSSVLISRVGGVGCSAAYYLAAAGIGRLVLAHKGEARPDDLNRQILMTRDGVGRPRVETASRRLRELNPALAVDPVAENVSESNAAALVSGVDLVIDAAPLFQERALLNREAVKQKKPLVDSAMYELQAQVTSIVPGRTPCLACLYPADPPAWKRKFPVFGAVAGMIGAVAAMEAIKILTKLGAPLLGRILVCDLRDMAFRTMTIQRDLACAVCAERRIS